MSKLNGFCEDLEDEGIALIQASGLYRAGDLEPQKLKEVLKAVVEKLTWMKDHLPG